MERDINSPEPQDDLRERYVDEKTREKIRKHLSDPNDKITPEDIANVNTEMYSKPETEEEIKEDDEHVEDAFPRKAPSAWDVKTDE